MLSKKYLSLFIFFFCVQLLSAQNPLFTGNSILIANNNKDIHHKRNEKFKNRLIQLATFDAIEKGTPINIQSEKAFQKSEATSSQGDSKFETYISSILEQYNVSWQRVSDYTFTKLEDGKWQCSVQGKIKELPIKVFRNIKQPIYTTPVSKKTYKYTENDKNIVTRKSFNKVHLNIGSKELEGCRKIVVIKQKNKQTLNGTNTSYKDKAYLQVIQSSEDFVVAKIIKGFWRVHQGDEIAIKYYRNGRSGLRFERCIMFKDEQLYINNKDIPSSYAIDFFTESYKTHLGFILGFEEISSKLLPEKINKLDYLRTGFYYNIAIIPDILFLAPEADIAILLPNESVNKYSTNIKDGNNVDNFYCQCKLNLSLRVGLINFDVGYGYKKFNNLEQILGEYVNFGLRVKIY